MKKIFACLLTVCLCSAGFAAPASAAASEKAAVTIADGVNVTRWDNFLVVYKDIAATGQNEWGHNIVVNADSQVVRILEGGDAAGKNLAVPAGGMVVSATGEKVEWLKDNIAIGDYVIYDDMTGRVMASAEKDFDLTFSVELTVTDFNAVRYAGTLVVYDRGETTRRTDTAMRLPSARTASSAPAGGNDSAIPAGGYVVSAIEEADRRFLAAYGVRAQNAFWIGRRRSSASFTARRKCGRTRCCRMKARPHRLRRQRPPAGFSMPTRRPICSRRCGR